MYKVLIVDDEVLVRVGLKSTIDWEALGFSVVAEASNGEQGFEAYKTYKPDVILTDIIMPKKDGLWLTKQVRQLDAQVKLLILTSYDDFTYAREALKSGADDYILKLEAEDEELIKIMTAIKERLDNELSQQEKYDRLIKHMDTNIGGMKGRILEDLLKSAMVVDERLQSMCLSLNFPIVDTKFSLIVFSRDDWERKVDFSTEEWQQMNSAVVNIVSSILEERRLRFLIRESNNQFIFLIASETIDAVQISRIIDLARSSVLQYFEIPLSAAVDNIFEDIKLLPELYKDMSQKLEQLFYLDESSVINASERSLQKINIFSIKKSYVQALLDNLNDENEEKAMAVLKETEDFFRKNNVKDIEVKLFYSNLLSSIFDRYYHCFSKSEELQDYTYYHSKIMMTVKMIKILTLIRGIVAKAIKNIKSYRHNNSNHIIREAITYVEKNYQKKITLKSLADHVNLSKHYVCYLFKKETGENLSHYINKLRIEKAKQMVVESNCKIKEIYTELGFADQQYFSRTFKKLTGMTVMEYRNSVLKPNRE